MATTSRTYLPTDWQVWTYTPVAGKFRLDFSTLNGSDVLGGVSDTGSMTVLDVDINSIMIRDGERPQQSVFGSVSPATASISMSTNTWNANTVKELYAGKYIAITLKNQAIFDVDVYGKNAVFFLGTISSSTYQVDPINRITTFVLEAVDIFSNAANSQIQLVRSTTTGKATSLLQAILNSNAGYDSHLVILPDQDLASTSETNTTEYRSLGEWIDDFVTTTVAIPISKYELAPTLIRRVNLYPLFTQPTTGTQITDSMVTAVQMATDGDDIPTSFNLSNTTTIYSKGQNQQGILTQPIDYTATLDVNGSSQLQAIADRISSYKPKLSPISITIKTAQTFQSIDFSNDPDYYFPNTWYPNGTNIDVYLAYFGNVHYYTKIVGQDHEITPDYWQTTYHLLKGL